MLQLQRSCGNGSGGDGGGGFDSGNGSDVMLQFCFGFCSFIYFWVGGWHSTLKTAYAEQLLRTRAQA